MKKSDIVRLMSCGVAEITSHCLTAEEAYRLYRFRRSLRQASEEIFLSEREMLKDVGIENVEKFDQRLKELRASRQPSAELLEMEQQLEKYSAMRCTMLDDTAPELYPVFLPYERWKSLQDENHTEKGDPLSGWTEEALEGIVWITPQA